jgi:hypothetical protein
VTQSVPFDTSSLTRTTMDQRSLLASKGNPNVLDRVRDLVLRAYEQQAPTVVHAVSQ